MGLWSQILFNVVVIMNLIVAFFYPFSTRLPDPGPHLSGLIWAVMLLSAAIAITLPKPAGIRTLIVTIIIRLICSAGPEPTLSLLGTFTVALKGIHLLSIMGNSGTFSRSLRQICTDTEVLYHVVYLMFCMLGLTTHPFFFSILLFDLVYREETLLNVIRSVTRNGRSIILTAVLALILVYMFSIIGYIFFRDDFLVEIDSGSGTFEVNSPSSCSVDGIDCNHTELLHQDGEDSKERACDSLIMCIITTMNQGLRNGGGIGDILRAPSSAEPMFVARVIYDLLFFFVVIIIVLNLIFGVIIDTFADLRSEKQQKEEILKNTCFICGLDRSQFDNKAVSFEDHIRHEHNMWHYLYFIVLIRVKDPTEFTGPESYVYSMVKDKNLEWFPRLRAISLAAEGEESEQNELRTLQVQLEDTQSLVRTLSRQLTELRDQMSEHRKQKQRMGLLNSAPPYLHHLSQ